MENQFMFPDLPDDSRVWIYAFPKMLTDSELETVQNNLDDFLTEWNSHGISVNGRYFIEYNRFVILCTESSEISGCSIDSSVRVFKSLKENIGLDALNFNLIHFREHGNILSVDRPDFQEYIHSGRISLNTVVFNTTIQTLGQVREGLWETELRNSWHAKAFKIPA